MNAIVIRDLDTAKKYQTELLAAINGEKLEFKNTNEDKWINCWHPTFTAGFEYRVKPKPVEVWGNYYKNLNTWYVYDTPEEAERMSRGSTATRTGVKFVEAPE